MDKQLKIGFIGLGIMGEPMCLNIMKAGYPMTVYDVDKEKVESFVQKGARRAESPSEVALKSDIIITMLPDNKIVEEVVLGQSGVIENMTQGKILVDMSTISPFVSKKIAARIAEKGGAMADAPVVKSSAAAISGDLGILVGGPLEVYEKIYPVLKCMGKNIIHMGDNGSGSVMKLCHNMLVGEISVAVSRMLVAAQKAGLRLEDAITAVSYGGGQNFYLDSKAENIKNEIYTPGFPLQYMLKDLGLAIEMCQALGVELDGAKAADRLYRDAVDNGYGKEDFSAIIKVFKR